MAQSCMQLVRQSQKQAATKVGFGRSATDVWHVCMKHCWNVPTHPCEAEKGVIIRKRKARDWSGVQLIVVELAGARPVEGACSV